MLRGFDPLTAEMGSLRELGSSRESSMQRGISLDVSYDERDISKVSSHLFVSKISHYHLTSSVPHVWHYHLTWSVPHVSRYHLTCSDSVLYHRYHILAPKDAEFFFVSLDYYNFLAYYIDIEVANSINQDLWLGSYVLDCQCWSMLLVLQLESVLSSYCTRIVLCWCLLKTFKTFRLGS